MPRDGRLLFATKARPPGWTPGPGARWGREAKPEAPPEEEDPPIQVRVNGREFWMSRTEGAPVVERRRPAAARFLAWLWRVLR